LLPGFIVARFVETSLAIAANLRRRSFVVRQNIVEARGERR